MNRLARAQGGWRRWRGSLGFEVNPSGDRKAATPTQWPLLWLQVGLKGAVPAIDGDGDDPVAEGTALW